MQCINCGHTHNHSFCPECGQPAGVKRLSLKGLFGEIQERFLGVDNLFMRTVLHLWTKPGIVVHSYLEGNRKKYLGAIAYLLLMISLMLIVFEMASVDSQAFYNQMSSELGADELSTQSQAVQARINNFMNTHMRLINFLLLPFYGGMSFLFFRKHHLNFTEHMAFFAYMQAQPIWFLIAAGLFYKYWEVNLASAIMWVSFAYAVWGSIGFFKSEKAWSVALKAIGLQLLVLVVISIIGGLAAVFFWM